MKNVKISNSLIACLLSLAILLNSCIHSNSTNISISESSDSFQFYASFRKTKTVDVQQYMNESLSPAGFFSPDSDYYEKTVSLKDGTNFYIKSSPGKIKIQLDKRENSEASYLKVKHICQRLKDVLK